MTLGGKRMMPLGLAQWMGILLAGGSAILIGYVAALSTALMGAQSPATLPMPLQLLLLAGIVGLLGGGAWVQFTWRTQHG